MNFIFDFFQFVKGSRFCRLPWCFRKSEENGFTIWGRYSRLGYCKVHASISKQVIKDIESGKQKI